MPRVRQVTDMVYDEVSLVDRPANQHADIVIAKRDEQEASVPDFFDGDGQPVTFTYDDEGNVTGGSYADGGEVAPGDRVVTADGQLLEFAPEGEREPELAVAKSAFGAPIAKSDDSGLSALREELAKALSEGGGDSNSQTISKALDIIEKAEQRASAAEQIAKAEQDLRLNREYIAKAQDYNLPIAADELGPVLKSMWEAEASLGALPAGSCAVIHKALSTSGDIFREIGLGGTGGPTDPMAEFEAFIDETVIGKSAGKVDELSKAEATVQFFRDNPAAYDQYLADSAR